MRSKFFVSLLLVLLFISSGVWGQLSYLGLDRPNGFDGYKKGLYSGGIITFKGKYYFTTPNGKLYETDGTMAGTITKRSSKGDMVFLKATNNYLYFSLDNGYGNTLRQYTPSNDFIREFSYTDYRFPTDRLCPSCEVAQAEGFVSQDGNRLYTRSFSMGKQYIREIDDRNNDVVTEIFSTPIPTATIDFQLIKTDTWVAEAREEVFFNGLINFRDPNQWETSVSAFQKVRSNPISYQLQTDYRLKSKGYTIYQNFLRTASSLYVLVRKADNSHFLARLENGLLRPLNFFPINAPFYYSVVLRGQIYLATQNKLYRYDEKADQLLLLHELSDTQFEKVYGGLVVIKAGDYLMFKTGGILKVLNEVTGKVDVLSPTVAFPMPARLDRSQVFAIPGKDVFYVLEAIGDKKVLNQYNPVKKSFIEIPMPVEKKETFTAYKYFQVSGDKLLILTEYRPAKEKDPSLYKMFFYKEQ